MDELGRVCAIFCPLVCKCLQILLVVSLDQTSTQLLRHVIAKAVPHDGLLQGLYDDDQEDESAMRTRAVQVRLNTLPTTPNRRQEHAMSTPSWPLSTPLQ